MSCPWYHLCPLRRFERQGRIGVNWKKLYCESDRDWAECKRYQLTQKGIPHPDNMLPDGRIDGELK